MKLIDRYIIRQMAANFFLIISALTALYLLVDVFERLDDFQGRHLPGSLAARYFLLKLPIILDQISPVSLLLAGIVTLGLLMNRRELQSLNAGGVSKIRVMVPFALGALVCTVFGLASAQWLLPAAGREANRIWRQEVNGERGEGIMRDGVTFFRGKLGVYAFRDQDQRHEVLREFRYQELDRSAGGAGLMTLYAKSATYSAGRWHFKNGQIRTGGDDAVPEPFSEKDLALPEKAATFFAPIALDFEQPLLTLIRRAVGDEQQTGHRQAVLNLNRRLSFLLLGLPLLCLALPIILCFELGRASINLAFAIPVSAGLAFLVWGVWSGMQALTVAAALPTLIASWSIHLLCVVSGAIIMVQRR
ncbi:MAG: LptF/LptG family permease [Desulfobulbaceae bacterium]|nr:LptF/LptG family permease [Desulfobulbaceae bacterium]